MYNILELKRVNEGVCLFCSDEPASMEIDIKKAHEDEAFVKFKICNTCFEQIKNDIACK